MDPTLSSSFFSNSSLPLSQQIANVMSRNDRLFSDIELLAQGNIEEFFASERKELVNFAFKNPSK